MCKAGVTKENVIPLYGRGTEPVDPRCVRCWLAGSLRAVFNWPWVPLGLPAPRYANVPWRGLSSPERTFLPASLI